MMSKNMYRSSGNIGLLVAKNTVAPKAYIIVDVKVCSGRVSWGKISCFWGDLARFEMRMNMRKMEKEEKRRRRRRKRTGGGGKMDTFQ